MKNLSKHYDLIPLVDGVLLDKARHQKLMDSGVRWTPEPSIWTGDWPRMPIISLALRTLNDFKCPTMDLTLDDVPEEVRLAENQQPVAKFRLQVTSKYIVFQVLPLGMGVDLRRNLRDDVTGPNPLVHDWMQIAFSTHGFPFIRNFVPRPHVVRAIRLRVRRLQDPKLTQTAMMKDILGM